MEDGLHEGASLRVVVQRIRRARLMLSVPLNIDVPLIYIDIYIYIHIIYY
jgi:hypothetical protein